MITSTIICCVSFKRFKKCVWIFLFIDSEIVFDLSLLDDHVMNVFVNIQQFSYSFFDSSPRIESIVLWLMNCNEDLQ